MAYLDYTTPVNNVPPGASNGLKTDCSTPDGGTNVLTSLKGDCSRPTSDCQATPGVTTWTGIRQDAGGVGVVPSLPAPAKNSYPLTRPAGDAVPKRSRGRGRSSAERWHSLKTGGGYLEYMQYYFGDDGDAALGVLERCHTTWYRESRGDAKRYRASGCGRRHDCPLCSTYVQSQLGADAFGTVSAALVALGEAGVVPDSYGLTLIFTLPKDASAKIDHHLLYGDTDTWEIEVNRLRTAASELVKRWFGLGVGYLTCLELTGESDPTEGHYHISVYVFPARFADDHWVPIQRWTTHLAEWRSDWTAAVNDLYGLSLTSANFYYDYLRTSGQLVHWLQYQYRPVLADLWRGWHYYDGSTLLYQYNRDKRLISLDIPRDELGRAFDRTMLLPKHFKRLRWAGFLADGVRWRAMESLGLEREAIDKESEDGWARDGTYFTLIRYEDGGVLLRSSETGAATFVESSFVEYQPLVNAGRRARWRLRGLGETLLELCGAWERCCEEVGQAQQRLPLN